MRSLILVILSAKFIRLVSLDFEKNSPTYETKIQHKKNHTQTGMVELNS